MNAIGILQGRLSNGRGKAQSFPGKDWCAELERARRLGFSALEWLVTDEPNPIYTDAGLREIQLQARRHSLAIPSLCADYLQSCPLDNEEAGHRLAELLRRAFRIGVTTVLVPVFARGGLNDTLLYYLREPLEMAERLRMTLALETDESAYTMADWIARARSNALGIYYDTGNAAANGYAIEREIGAIEPYLAGIHIKDKDAYGRNVPLGTGIAPLDLFLHALKRVRYDKPLILETTAGNDWQANARANLGYLCARMGDGAREHAYT